VSGHVKGPWKATEDGLGNWDIECEDGVLATLQLWPPDLEANARLLAAAPEMLEALREAVVILDTTYPDMSKRCRAVIGKAEGRQP
jgi:hypothetical protein